MIVLTDISFEVVEIKNKDGEKVYDIHNMYKQEQSTIDEYINFTPHLVRVSRWEAQYGFVAKDSDADILFQAYVEIKDDKKVRKIYLDSSELKVSIRGERLFVYSHKIEDNNGKWELDIGQSSMVASDSFNLYLLDAQRQNVNTISQLIHSNSLAKEKIILSLENISWAGNKIPLIYPIIFSIFENGKKIWGDISLSSSDLKSFKSLSAIQKSGNYSVEISDSKWFKTTKTFDILPEVVSKWKMELGTTLLKTVRKYFYEPYDFYWQVW